MPTWKHKLYSISLQEAWVGSQPTLFSTACGSTWYDSQNQNKDKRLYTTDDLMNDKFTEWIVSSIWIKNSL